MYSCEVVEKYINAESNAEHRTALVSKLTAITTASLSFH